MSPSETPSVPPVSTRRVVIQYCRLCQWMLRAAWLAQELLSTFSEELEEVSLQPGTGGVFAIWYGEQLLWERRRDGGFPEAREIKQRLRDHLCPERSLGHSDNP